MTVVEIMPAIIITTLIMKAINLENVFKIKIGIFSSKLANPFL